jgi:kinesin family protein 12
MNSNKLEIRGSQEEGFYVENLHSIYIETLDELMSLLKEGELNRATASHILNDHSSRSHAVLTIEIENDTQNLNNQANKAGKLIFVDLAG